MECPNCHLENPPFAQQCDCGHIFGQPHATAPKLLHPRRETNVSKCWISSLYILAFIRAAVALWVALGAVINGSTTNVGFLSVGTWAFADAILLIFFGVAVYKGYLWAAYGLTIAAALDVPIKLTESLVVSLASLLWVVAFTIGSIHLFRSKGFTSRFYLDMRFVFRWTLILMLIGFVSGFLQTFNPAFLARMLGAPGSEGRVLGLRIVANLLLLGSQTIAAKRKAEWPLEHILFAALASWLFASILDGISLIILRQLSLEIALVSAVNSGIFMFVLTFLAYGIAQKLKAHSPASNR